ncbi:hypothetical protein KZP23_06735 [Echinicola marina]|uniref:hypothetical protein n=1 Tax=Echinicola marina TaxID=2859768 RepID=UPI001CF6C65B|nr:hypothetical protein [Echinicola marina]UCS94701.1 hypothetical protein KZP23_06735 [Echinicola marina]
MKEASQISELMKQVDSYVQNCPENTMEYKAFPHKWSKKEILGHLVDSAIHNLQRFVEIQFSPSVYSVHPYRQNEWVSVNDYQHTNTQSLLQL